MTIVIKNVKTNTIADWTQTDIEALINNQLLPAGTTTANVTLASDWNTPFSTSMSTNKLLGRATTGTGIFEEIILGTGLSFTGTTLNASGSGGGVVSVTGLNTDNGDPTNPVVKISVDGVTITGSGTPTDPLISVSGGSGTVTSVGLSSTNSTLVIGSTPVTTSGVITADIDLTHANTWTGQQTFNTSAPIIGTATVSTIAGFDASKNLITLATSTYPSLTEFSYVKGVTSAIQTQLTARELLSNKATDFTTINNTLYPTVQAVNNAITTAVTGLLDYRGSYDASTNLYPATGGSGLVGAILKGDFWVCSVGGTLGGTAVTPGDLIIALVDTPGQTSSNWDLIPHDLGSYVTSVTGTTNRITSSGGSTPAIDISASYVGQTSITTLGTIATGTWSGLFGAVTGANLTHITAANIDAGTAGINISGNAATVTGATLTKALTVNTGTVTLTGNAANTSALTIGAGAVSVSGSNTGDQTSVSGNAGTATALQNARNIGGVSFDGTADIVPQTIASINEATDTTCFPLFITASGTQSLQPKNNTSLTFNSNTANLGCTTFTGALVGNADTATSAGKWTTARNLAGNSVDGSGNVAFANKFIVQGTSDSGLSAAQFLGSLGTGILKNTTTTGALTIAVAGDFPTLNQNTTGSAATLTTPRAINGVNFDGSAGITITAAAGTLTGTTLNATVVTSSLTSLGTIGTGVWQGTVIDGTYLNYNTTNLQVSSSKINTIQDIATTSTPRFARVGLGQAADASAVMAATGQYFSTEFDNGNVTGTATIDFNNGNVQYATMTGNVTLTFSNPKAGGRYVLQLAGAFTPTFPGTVRWSGGTTPTATVSAGHKDIYTFIYSGKESLYDGAANLNFATT